VSADAYTTYENRTECSEMSVHKVQTTGIHPKARAQHVEYRERLKNIVLCFKKENLRKVCIKTNLTVTCRKHSLFVSFAVFTPFYLLILDLEVIFVLDHTR